MTFRARPPTRGALQRSQRGQPRRQPRGQFRALWRLLWGRQGPSALCRTPARLRSPLSSRGAARVRGRRPRAARPRAGGSPPPFVECLLPFRPAAAPPRDSSRLSAAKRGDLSAQFGKTVRVGVGSLGAETEGCGGEAGAPEGPGPASPAFTRPSWPSPRRRPSEGLSQRGRAGRASCGRPWAPGAAGNTRPRVPAPPGEGRACAGRFLKYVRPSEESSC